MYTHAHNLKLDFNKEQPQALSVDILQKDIEKLEHTVKQQKIWLQHKSAPLGYRPWKLVLIDHPTRESLNRKFLKDFNTILMKHLTEAIEANTVTLEIKKVRLQSILDQSRTTSHHQPQPSTRNTASHPQPSTRSTDANLEAAINQNTPSQQGNKTLPLKRKSLSYNENQRKVQKKLNHFLVKRQRKESAIT